MKIRRGGISIHLSNELMDLEKNEILVLNIQSLLSSELQMDLEKNEKRVNCFVSIA